MQYKKEEERGEKISVVCERNACMYIQCAVTNVLH